MTPTQPLASTQATTHTLAEEIAMIHLVVREAGNDANDRIAARSYIRYLKDQDAGISPQQRLELDAAVA